MRFINSSIDSSDLSSANFGSASTDELSSDPNLDPNIHTCTNSNSASSIALHPTMVLASCSLSLPVPGVQVATNVVQFDDNDLNVDNKRKEYQQF